MSTNQSDNNDRIYDDEIELRELIVILWNRKIMIIGITLAFVLLAGLYSRFLIAPEYRTRFSVVARIPETYTTKYGDYSLPIKSNTEYLNLIKSNEVINKTIKDLGYDEEGVSVDSIKNRISFAESYDDNIFNIVVSGSNPEEIVKLADQLYFNYLEYLDLMILDKALNYYREDFTVKIVQNETKLDSNSDLLARHEELLESVPKTIDQKSVMEEIPNTNDYIILENIVNPNYTHLEFNILEIKQNINILENANQEYSLYLEELIQEQAKIDKHLAGDQEGQIEIDLIDNMDIFRMSEPLVPRGKSGPSITRNAIIAGLLGGMISVFVAFFMAYWKREI